MPELPEVETIRLGLQKYLVGHTIEHVTVKLSKMVTGDTKHLVGGKIKGIRRFGKGLVIDVDNNYSIAIHIKLTGQLVYVGKDEPHNTHLATDKLGGSLPNAWTHVIFDLDHGAKLFYNDQRQFGWIKILKTVDVLQLPFFKELGPEPFGRLTYEVFVEILSSSSMAIKPLLLDQKKIGGIGNIYANDGLFLAGIDPRRKARSLSSEEVKKLYDSLLAVLKKGLKYGGASELNYVNALGEKGGYQHHFLVYARQGMPCHICKTSIKKFVLGGRGTYYCQTCQK